MDGKSNFLKGFQLPWGSGDVIVMTGDVIVINLSSFPHQTWSFFDEVELNVSLFQLIFTIFYSISIL